MESKSEYILQLEEDNNTLLLENEYLEKMKAQVDKGIDLQAKEIDRREKVILEKDLEINKLNLKINEMHIALLRYRQHILLFQIIFIAYLIWTILQNKN